MSRYIDLHLIDELVDSHGNVHYEDLQKLPTADVVEVVRCKDCKHRFVNEHYGQVGYLQVKAVCDKDTGNPFDLARNANDDGWFCADGERV